MSPLRQLRVWTWSLAGWTLVGGLVLVQSTLQQVSGHQPVLLHEGQVLGSMWLWASFTPFIFQLTDRFPPGPWWPVHGVLAIASAFLDACITTWLLYPMLGWGAAPFWAYFSRELFVCVASYAMLVAIRHAMNVQRLATERRLVASALETELARSRLEALQLQLRPHFLFNALHSVGALVRAGEAQQAVRTLAGLGELLRRVLQHESSQCVPLCDELELLDRYLGIEKVRFQERLITRVEVEPRAMRALVPSLILQPLVENAVRHGLAQAERPGVIEVVARVSDSTLSIEVRDSGVGLPVDREPGIGLKNTQARLKHLYGERQRLALRPGDAGGTVAELSIPFEVERR